METKSGLMENEAAKITQFYNLLTSSIDVIRTFCDRIPGIGELGAKDRDLLFQSACLELFTLRLAYRQNMIKLGKQFQKLWITLQYYDSKTLESSSATFATDKK